MNKLCITQLSVSKLIPVCQMFWTCHWDFENSSKVCAFEISVSRQVYGEILDISLMDSVGID